MPTESRHFRERRLAELLVGWEPPISDEGPPVSIQIADSNNPRMRLEVAERIGALVRAFRGDRSPDENGTEAEFYRENAISDAARSLFFGLVGSYPTAEEYAVMNPQ